MASLIRLLADDGALQYAVPVLYNICVDYGMNFSPYSSLLSPKPER